MSLCCQKVCQSLIEFFPLDKHRTQHWARLSSHLAVFWTHQNKQRGSTQNRQERRCYWPLKIPPRVTQKCHAPWHLTALFPCSSHVVISLMPSSYMCVFSSLCIPVHLGLHNGLHRDPTGGKWKSCVHGGGPRAAAGCVTGQCPLYLPSHPSLPHSYSIYFMTHRTTLGRLFSEFEGFFFLFSMFFNVLTLHYWSGCCSSRSSINLYYPGGKCGWQSPWLQSNNIYINHTERWFKQTVVHLAEKKFPFLLCPPVFLPTVRHLFCFVGSSELSLQLQLQRHQFPEFPTDTHRLWDARVPLATRWW